MYFSFRKYFLAGGAGVFVLFLLVAGWYIDKRHSEDVDQFKTHAVIIADKVWAVDRAGVETYLELAANLNSFKSLSVAEPDGRLFVAVEGAPLSGFDRILVQANLTFVRHMSADILYKDEHIAVLEGDRYIRLVFPLLNILIIIVFLTIIVVFLRYLFFTRYFLQKLVVERTQKLRESERRFEDLVNLLPEMVWETDLEGYITYINQAGTRRFGRVADGSGLYFDVLEPRAREQAKIKFSAALLGHDTGLQEFQAIEKDGTAFPLLLRCSPRYRHGQAVGMRMLGVDISERIKLEEQLQRDRRMKALGLMAGGVAHDLNNILSGVVGYPDLLLLDIPHDSSLRAPVEAIKKSGMQAAEVVADLLTVVRGGVVNRDVIDLNHLVEEYFDSAEFKTLQRAHSQIVYSFKSTPELATISCSAMHIRKALMNLVINSTEAIEGAGEIEIFIYVDTIEQPLECHNGILEPGSYVRIAVCDNGVGIAAKDIDHIFEPFYSKKVMGKSGTGLGMALVWNAVMDHDGGIRLFSDTNGTIVELYFALDSHKQLELSERPIVLNGHDDHSFKKFMGNGEKILVVDDELQQRDLADRMLSLLGYSVTCVASGEEALAYLTKSSVDFLVLDMLMPPGINGYETYAEVVKMYPEQKAAIVSGYAELADVQSAMKIGACGIVHKPYTIEQIGKMVYGAL